MDYFLFCWNELNKAIILKSTFKGRLNGRIKVDSFRVLNIFKYFITV